MNKIICPVDFSDTSLNALEYAVEIARKFHSHLTLIHVFTESDFNKLLDEKSVSKTFKERLNMADVKLEGIVKRMNEDYKKDGVSCEYKLELGDLMDNLLKEFKNGYNLCVMGTTGISRSNDMFWGSNTEEVIEKAKIPTLCIPIEASFEGFRKIVYASDFMAEDKKAIQEVISFATMFDARISVLHINVKNNDREYKEFVSDLRSFIQYQKINFVNKEFKDEIGLGIEEYMEEENSDLLMVFRKSRGFLGDMFHKSLTSTLSYSMSKPLFVLKFS
ncbi:universal stress protein [Fulvivirga sediminis]|uniref:Universal stress protein n=1 Tax=Fulvivirga sediminis TaxID=2803949 RepID=A0A937FB47_9BACT|nr:universal stress protein [Fulvivirga sediminis]MBL3658372.1 universal stress protein [Fulvivirga sediminis]